MKPRLPGAPFRYRPPPTRDPTCRSYWSRGLGSKPVNWVAPVQTIGQTFIDSEEYQTWRDNTVAVRMEERIALTINRPESFVNLGNIT
jgi:hypothetical protein